MVTLPSDQDFSSIGVPKDSKDVHFVTAGSKGVLKVWNSRTGVCVFTQKNSHVAQEDKKDGKEEDEEDEESRGHQLVSLSYSEKLGTFNVTTFEKNIVMYKKEDMSVKKQVRM